MGPTARISLMQLAILGCSRYIQYYTIYIICTIQGSWVHHSVIEISVGEQMQTSYIDYVGFDFDWNANSQAQSWWSICVSVCVCVCQANPEWLIGRCGTVCTHGNTGDQSSGSCFFPWPRSAASESDLRKDLPEFEEMEIVHVLAATTLLHRYDIKPKRYADRNRPGSGSFSTCVVLSGHVGSSFIIFSSIYSILTSIPRSAFGRKIRFNCSRQTCCVNEMCLLFLLRML